VFGYGELNVGKAVNGPAKFDWGDVTVSFAGNSTWSNPISGAGGLVKQGTGTLNLTQASTYTGATQVQSGTLTAKSLASVVSIAAGGTLSGTSKIGRNIINAGTRALSDRFDNLLDHRQPGGWTQNLGYHGDLSRSGYSNVGVDLTGWLVGQDYRMGGNGEAGYAISQSQGLGRLANSPDQGRSHALEGMLYGGVIHGSWYTMGRFGVGTYRENMRRQLQLGNQFAGVASDTNGRYGVAYGESGYRLSLGRTEVTPYINLQYAHLQRDGFDELGAYGFGLKSSAQTTALWQAGMGMRATQAAWALPRGGSLSLQTCMLWQQSFGVRGESFDASFSGIHQFAPVGGIGLA